MGNKVKTLSFGELLWDLFPGYKTPGGSPANIAYHLHTLGNESHLLTRVGNDPTGAELLEFIGSKGLKTTLIQTDSHQPTGIVTVHVDEKNEPSYTIHEPSAWDFIELNETLNRLAGSLDAICYASLSQRSKGSKFTIQALIERVPDSCIKVFDLNLRPPFFNPEEVLNDIRKADLVKMNEDEFKSVSRVSRKNDSADIGRERESTDHLKRENCSKSLSHNARGRFCGCW